MKKLELKVLPVIIVLIVASIMSGFNLIWPYEISLSNGMSIIAGAISLLAMAIGAFGVVEFRKAQTTLHPSRLENTSTLVTRRIFALSRNPMYLSFLLFLISWAIFLENPLLTVGPMAFVLYMNKFQIIPEERAMEKIFGDEYKAYCKSVRRWV